MVDQGLVDVASGSAVVLWLSAVPGSLDRTPASQLDQLPQAWVLERLAKTHSSLLLDSPAALHMALMPEALDLEASGWRESSALRSRCGDHIFHQCTSESSDSNISVDLRPSRHSM